MRSTWAIAALAVAVLPGCPQPDDPPPAAISPWQATPPMVQNREFHAAVRLVSGDVLVLGGHVVHWNPPGPLASVERYQVATDSWVADAPMVTARSHAPAVLLGSGDVLVCGGVVNWGAAYIGTMWQTTTASERYQPGSGSWSSTGALNTARSDHTLSVLGNGQVLAAGGIDSATGFSTATAELYDPVAGTWTATGSLATARHAHTASTLQDGRVLVVAGISGVATGTTLLASAEIYDPAVGTWTSAGAMQTPRRWHSAVALPNSEVLVAGGRDLGTQTTVPVAIATAEVYTPGPNTWWTTAVMPTARSRRTLTLVGNGSQVLGAGGGNLRASGSALGDAAMYDVATRSWTVLPSMHWYRAGHTATLLQDGSVLCAGGSGNTDPASWWAERYR